jgi:hypothetical protein
MERMEVELHSLLTPAIQAGDWSVPHSGSFMPEDRVPVSTEYGAGRTLNCCRLFEDQTEPLAPAPILIPG